jgi:hypothetical protein
VRHPHEVGSVRSDLRRPPLRLDLDELRGPQQAVLVQLRLDEPEGEPRGPYLRDAHLTEEERQRARVILVPVRDDDGADVVLSLPQVREVRQDEIDAEVLVAREREACVDDDDPVVGLDDEHVLADLAEAAQRDQAG